jgi:GTP-binding protein
VSKVPLIALVGRPNVGKSTLFNRLVGRRVALVHDRPGVTRDRNFGETHIDGKVMRVVDTGGFDSDPGDPLLDRMRQQTQLAIDEADLVILLLDGVDGVRPADQEVLQLLRRSETPVVAVVNKVDDPKRDGMVHDFHKLGVHPLIALSE